MVEITNTMLENYDDVLSIQDLREILKIGRAACYDLLKTKQIYSRKICGKYRIPKAALIEFLVQE